MKKLISCLLGIFFYSSSTSAKTSSAQVYWQQDKHDQVFVYADNPSFIPQWADISLGKLNNLRVSQNTPLTFTLKPRTKKVLLFTLTPGDSGAFGFELTTRIVPGKDPAQTRHDNNHLYQFPFSHGKKYPLGQGYFGPATHFAPNPYALDFGMDTGTAIMAARAGIVSEVKQDSNLGGPDPRFAKHGNHIVIYQQDGTFATYVHLKKNGARVNVGDRVSAGQKIGLSGNTGQSSAPHLHFEVFKYTRQGQPKNLPVSFLNHDHKAISQFKQGLYYYATDPGRPKYPIVLGSALKNQDFAKVTRQANTGELEITSKLVDRTVVVSAKNGKTSAMEIEVTLNLTNYTASKRYPITTSVPALSEKFLVLLRPIDNAKPGKYGYSYISRIISPDIDDSVYQQKRKRVAKTNAMQIIKQEVGDNILFYASNGYTISKELTIELKMRNMTASKGRQLTVSVPPLTQIYLQHVRPTAPMKPSQISYSYHWR